MEGKQFSKFTKSDYARAKPEEKEKLIEREKEKQKNFSPFSINSNSFPGYEGYKKL